MSTRRHLLALSPLALGALVFPQPLFAGAGTQMVINFVQEHFINNALVIFGPLAIAFIFFYGYKAIMESGNESALTDAIKSLIYALSGFGIIAAAATFATAFKTGNMTTIFGSGGTIDGIIRFLSTLAGGIFTLVMTLSGLRLVASGGESGEADKLKKSIAMNIAGVVLMLFANAIVASVAGNEPGIILTEIGGFVRFILSIIGIVSVLAMIAAGIMLIVSVDEPLRDRAKKTVTGTIITLVIITASYTLIALFT